jgi:A/G-specific adenine glycosylase
MRKPSRHEVGHLRVRLSAWFAAKGRSFPWRKRTATLYEQIVTEVLLQRTRAEVVAAFFPRFKQRYPSWKGLARATETDLRVLLRPLGLWRRRASSLLKLARVVARNKGRFPRTRSEIEALPSVGQYICNAVLLFANRQAEPLLDVNMARVLERCFGLRRLADIRYDPELQAISRLLVSGPHAIEINWAILDLAAMVCVARLPRCSDCPIKRQCGFYKINRLATTVRIVAPPFPKGVE